MIVVAPIHGHGCSGRGTGTRAITGISTGLGPATVVFAASVTADEARCGSLEVKGQPAEVAAASLWWLAAKSCGHNGGSITVW